MPEVIPGILPHLTVDNATAAIEYYKKAMNAQEVMRMPHKDGKRIMHAQLKIGTATLMLADDFPEYAGGKSRTPKALGATPVTLHQYVPDVDAAIKQCADAGGTVNMPAQDMFWGDRYGQVTDPSGHVWSFSTPIKG